MSEAVRDARTTARPPAVGVAPERARRRQQGRRREWAAVAWFALRRFVISVAALVGLAVVVFIASRLQGPPAASILPDTATPEQIDQLNHQLGYDQPLLTQLWQYLTHLARLDFGESLWLKQPALEVALSRIGASLWLCAVAMLIITVVFIPAGVLASLRPGGVGDRLVFAGTTVGISLPSFWFGAMLILIFGVQLGWLPTFGWHSAAGVVLPAVTLAVGHGSRVAQVARSAMIEQMNARYVQAWSARGIPKRALVSQHALRNALLPISSMYFWEISVVLGGVVTVETVFAWPGLGQLLIQSIRNHDVVLLQCAVMLMGSLVIAANLVADVVMRLLDPRVDLQ